MILIIDDDPAVRASLSLLLKRSEYEVQAASSPMAAIDMVRYQAMQLILMDMNYSLATSGKEGLELLKKIKIFQPDVPVILMTAWGSISLAVEGMRSGAFDFITKPWNNTALLHTVETAINLNKKNNAANQTIANFDKIIGKSQSLKNVLATVARIAPTNASVLITGESGTGKELIAEAIHANSPRVNDKFVKVNLGGMSQSLFESEMFGHKKGAFTDAYSDRTGRFELANKGTIFLDEIGELDMSCQVKLLRVLQDQTYEMLGDSTTKRVDVRVVSATNRDLYGMVEEHRFREDLFYRINLITINLPALRERKEDIPLLACHFAASIIKKNHLPEIDFSADAMDYLQSLLYPGNIRELKNLIERTIIVSSKNMLTADDFRKEAHTPANQPTVAVGLTIHQTEKQLIEEALIKYKNNLSKVADALGISRTALYRRLKKYGLNEN